MAKEIIGQIKLQITAGKANPSPPLGPALGQHGVNIMDFCKQFNAQTQGQEDMVIPVVISVYKNRSFSFITKTPPTSVLLKKEARISSGSARPQKDKVGKITREQLENVAGIKQPDLNSVSKHSAFLQVLGTARSMGLDVSGLEKESEK